MKKTEEVMARARDVNPVPPDAFHGLAQSPDGQQLLETIVATTPAGRLVRRSPRRAVGGLLAAAVLVSAGAVAAAVTLSRPDPQQAAQVENDFTQQATVHLDGWRPELDAEKVLCVFPEPLESLETSASEFPLRQRLTSKDLALECAEGNDVARNKGPFPFDSSTVCVIDEGAYPKAIVGVGGVECPPPARAMTPTDLDELNRMRAIEVAILAVPSDDGCPTKEHATEWAEARSAEYEVTDLEVQSSGSDGCFRGLVYWEPGHILIQTAGNQPIGLQEKPNEWALACESVGLLIGDQASNDERDSASEQLAALLETYGDDYQGGVFQDLVGPVVDGAERDDLEPARKFHAPNC